MADSTTKTLGVDLAKQLFAICETNHSGHVIRRLELRRDAFCHYLPQLPSGTVVAMEACSGAHHWARICLRHGLQARLIAAQFVTPFRKSARSKNDRNDAEAIATAARQGNMRFVAVKDVDQQARLCWHRVREGYKVESLVIANRLRGLLAEFGLTIARSDSALQRAVADDRLRAQLPPSLLPLLDDLYAHWQQVKQRIETIDRRIATHARADARSVRAQQLVGVGPLTADALVASIGNGHEFANGRQLAAWLGLTPSQHSSGGKSRLGGITCRGDNYLRTLLIQGARSTLQQAKVASPQTASAEQIWIVALASRLPFGKVLVAIANKHARQLWAMLRRGEDYDSEAWLHHPMVQRASRKAMAA